MTRAREIATSLTKAQRRAILTMSSEPQVAGRATFSWAPAYNLLDCGVTVSSAMWTGPTTCRDGFALTELGQEVRDILLQEKGQ
jgi:hypothetical protein